MAVSRVSLSSITQGFPKSRSFLDGNSAYIPSSFESIATISVTGTQKTLSFTSIPATYKHLQLRFMGGDSAGNLATIRFNSDSGSNYAKHYLSGTGSGASAGGTATQTSIGILTNFGLYFASSITTVSIMDIVDYASTSKYKTFRAFSGCDTNGGAVGQAINLDSGLWQSTSAISQIDLTTAAASFASGTTFALYGIKG